MLLVSVNSNYELISSKINRFKIAEFELNHCLPELFILQHIVTAITVGDFTSIGPRIQKVI